MPRKRFSDTGPFALVPEWVLDLPISDRALRLYAVLGRYADDHGEGWPSRRTLANRLRCSVDAVDRAKRELVDHDALEVEHRLGTTGAPTSNLYRLVRVDPAAALRPPSTDAATWPQECDGGSRTGAAQNENHERQPMNERSADVEGVEKDAPDDAERERVAAHLAGLRSERGFVKRSA